MNKRTALATLLLAVAAAAHAGTPDIPDDINARLARAKSQQASDTATRGGALATLAGATAIGGVGGAASSAPGAGCNIAIGNIIEDKGRISTSARRETTVIVTGDVIQVGNNCR